MIFEAIELLLTGRSNSNNNNCSSNLLIGNNDLFDHLKASDYSHEQSTHADNESTNAYSSYTK
jgi:hypothetical protein